MGPTQGDGNMIGAHSPGSMHEVDGGPHMAGEEPYPQGMFFSLGDCSVDVFTSFEGKKDRGQGLLLHPPPASERRVLNPPALSHKPIAGWGSWLQMALPNDGKSCLPTVLNPFISVLLVIPCPTAESDAKQFWHLFLPQTMA